jgi:hypothetical protein
MSFWTFLVHNLFIVNSVMTTPKTCQLMLVGRHLDSILFFSCICKQWVISAWFPIVFFLPFFLALIYQPSFEFWYWNQRTDLPLNPKVLIKGFICNKTTYATLLFHNGIQCTCVLTTRCDIPNIPLLGRFKERHWLCQ